MKQANRRAIVCTVLFLLCITGMYIASPKGTQGKYEGAASKSISAYRIDINTAPERELCRLHNLGEATARAIIAYREAHGKFRSVDELTKVRGVGEKKLALWKDYLCVS